MTLFFVRDREMEKKVTKVNKIVLFFNFKCAEYTHKIYAYNINMFLYKSIYRWEGGRQRI
jgi:hypothetical protein